MLRWVCFFDINSSDGFEFCIQNNDQTGVRSIMHEKCSKAKFLGLEVTPATAKKLRDAPTLLRQSAGSPSAKSGCNDAPEAMMDCSTSY